MHTPVRKVRKPMVARTRQNPTLPFHENRDNRTEQLLKRLGINYEFMSDLTPAQIDVQRSLANQARDKSLNEDTVANYTEKAREGVKFPPIIVYRTNRGRSKKFMVADGNHRVASHQAVQLSLDAYVLDVDTPPDVIETLTCVCNMGNGLPLTPGERLSRAAGLKENHNYTVANAAKMFGVSEPKLRDTLAKRAADRRAVDVEDVDDRMWEGLPQGIRKKLNLISTDEIFAEAIKLAHTARLTLIEVGELVDQLGRTKAVTKQRAILQAARVNYEDRVAATMGGKTSKRAAKTPKQQLAIAMGFLAGLPNNVNVIAKSYVGDDRLEAVDQLEPIVERLSLLLEELRAA